jgi:hypothetical protein
MEIIKIIERASNFSYFPGSMNPFPDKNHQNKRGKEEDQLCL